MSGKLAKEIHKSKPFESVQQELFLNVIRTADHLMRGFEELLKPHNLSATQYNVLRILRGHCGGKGEGCTESGGIPCKLIGEQMITRDPDITRLLDRLENRGLITRARDTRDRRVVSTRITAAGLGLLEQLDGAVNGFHQKQLEHVPEAQLTQAVDLLEAIRADAGE